MSYLGQILLKMNDLGHFFNSQDDDLFKNAKDVYMLTRTLRYSSLKTKVSPGHLRDEPLGPFSKCHCWQSPDKTAWVGIKGDSAKPISLDIFLFSYIS